MSLYENISSDMKEAMKSQDKETLSTIRMLKSAIDLAIVNAKMDRSNVPDDIVIEVASRQVKNYKENIEEFEKANRNDLADGLKREIEIISKYLPEQLSEEEIRNILNEIFDEVKPICKQDMGKIMKEANAKLKGKADFKLVSQIVNERLSNL